MVPEKKAGMNQLSGMTTKNKVVAGLLVVVVIFLLWQVMGLFGGKSEAPPEPAPTKQQMNANAAGGGGAGGATPGAPAGGTPNAGAGMSQPSDQTQLHEAPVGMDARIVDLQKQTQQKYIDQLNQLQTLKVQREIAETNQAIATARLATVTAEKSVSDILTKPTPQQVPVGAYSAPLVNPTLTGVPVATEGQPTGAPTEVPPPPPTAAASYVVISVSMQLGRWSAVLGYQGKLYNVSIGDVLPIDGSVVASINKNGVLLVKNGERRKISIISSI